MPVIVVANPKGGVGKTTLSTNLAGYLASRGHAVMLGDVDRQQSSRTWLGLRPAGLPKISAWEIDPRRRRAPAQGHDPRRARHARRPARQAPRRGDEAGRQGADPAAAEHLRHPRHARFHQPAARPPAQRPACRSRWSACAPARARSRPTSCAASSNRVRVPLLGFLRDTQNYVHLAAHGLTLWDVASARFERDREQWEPIIDLGRTDDAETLRQARRAAKPLVGEEIAVSDWIEVTQERIELFADATNDHQWIHVDPERAKAGPFGTTIAHGFLTLVAAAGDGALRRFEVARHANGRQLRPEPGALPGAGARRQPAARALQAARGTSRSKAARS